MHRYRSRKHPNNGVTYIVVGNLLISSGGCEYRLGEGWDWSDIERID